MARWHTLQIPTVSYLFVVWFATSPWAFASGSSSKHVQSTGDVADSRAHTLLHHESLLQANSPTNQPPSAGQDSQECAFILLPERLMLAPKVSESTMQAGFWTTAHGAILVSWMQKLYGWSFENIYFYVQQKLFFKTEVLQTQYEHAATLPTLPSITDDDEQGVTILLKDCTESILYIIRERKDREGIGHKIYNRLGEFVAQSYRGDLVPNQINFFDDENTPIAFAQSPYITDDVLSPHPPDVRKPGGLMPWEVRFVPEFKSNSSMTISQNRWVITASVQMRAIRDAARGEDGRIERPWFFKWFLLLTALFAMLVCALSCTLFMWIYRLVYPERLDFIENPFLREPNWYGSLPSCKRTGAALPGLMMIPAATQQPNISKPQDPALTIL